MTSNIFGNKEPPVPEAMNEKIETHSKVILTIIERLKNSENNLDLINEKLELLDHNSVKNFKRVFNEIKAVREEIRDLKHEVDVIKEFDHKASKQIRLMSTVDEVKKLEKYIDLWNPMEFVTRQELDTFREKLVGELSLVIEDFMREDRKRRKEEDLSKASNEKASDVVSNDSKSNDSKSNDDKSEREKK